MNYLAPRQRASVDTVGFDIDIFITVLDANKIRFNPLEQELIAATNHIMLADFAS